MYKSTTWEFLPQDILVEIFKYLPRRDRLACSMVSLKWKEALDSPCLWSNMVIQLDTDLMESSTMHLTRVYYKYIKCLELGFANPQLPTRWLSYRFQEITKRACRYIIILNECFVQLDCIKIHDWYEICRFKKIVYHLSVFLRSQIKLQKISFRNAYLNKTDFIKIFLACRNSENTITTLDLRTCYYRYEHNYLSAQFVSIIAQMENLLVLNVDYTNLCREIITALMTSRSTKLKQLNVYIQNDDMTHTIKDETWEQLHKKYPSLKIGFHFRNVSNSEGIIILLKRVIGLSVFSITCGKNLCYRNILEKIIKSSKNTLEILNFHSRENHELVDDLLLQIIKTFPRLQSFEFYGVIASFDLIRELCKFQNQLNRPKFSYFKLLPKNMNTENQVYLGQIYDDAPHDKMDCNFDMRIKHPKLRNMVYFYY